MRVGMVGSGFAAQHLALLGACSKVEVAWLCYGSDRDRAKTLAEKNGIGRIGVDLNILLRDPVDLVVVVSPPALHAAHALAALEAGAEVVIDKPLSATLDEARRIAAVADALGRRGLTFFQWRFDERLGQLRGLIRERALGTIRHVDAQFRHGFLKGTKTDWPWRHRAGDAGALGDLGIHLLDAMRWVTAAKWDVEFARSGVSTEIREGPAGERIMAEACDYAMAALRAGACFGHLFVSRAAAGDPEFAIRVTGDDGTASLSINPDTGDGSLTFDGVELRTSHGGANPYAVWLDHPDERCATLADGAEAQRLMVEITALASNNRETLQRSRAEERSECRAD